MAGYWPTTFFFVRKNEANIQPSELSIFMVNNGFVIWLRVQRKSFLLLAIRASWS